MGTFSRESAANDRSPAESAFENLKTMLLAHARGIDIFGVHPDNVQAQYEHNQRVVVSGMGGNRRQGTAN